MKKICVTMGILLVIAMLPLVAIAQTILHIQLKRENMLGLSLQSPRLAVTV